MFSHLHVHSEKSLLDGAARIKDLIDTTKALGMNSIAITDHGNMFGVIDFWEYAREQGIKPVLGCEVYTAMRKRTDKDSEKDKRQGHLVLLAENNTGYKNLMKIVSAAYKDGYYYKPRVDNDLLRQYSEGIIALSACLLGRVPQALLAGDYEQAKQEAQDYMEIFGKDNFFIEIMEHGLDDQKRVNTGLVNIAEELGLEMVVTNDVHYVKKSDAKAQAVLMCVQMQKVYQDDGKYAFGNDEFYLKSEEEMRLLFPEFPDAYENTQKIADRCNVEIDFSQRHLPDFTAPDGLSNSTYLRKLCEKGLVARYGKEASKHQERLDYEIKTIEDMGFIEYFLIVWDFIRFAKEEGIAVGPGRGSAAGSIVAYTLNITDIDPIRYNLIFERFLNPERVSMPDIDIDFCVDRRAEVIDYVNHKYGEDKVCQIITFGTMKTRMAIKDVARALDIPLGEVDKIVKLIPYDLSMTIEYALSSNAQLRELVASNPRYEELFDIAKQLEGVSRNAGTHAAGVVICKSAIDDVVPVYYSQKKGLSTQFTMTRVEELGLLKMDFLGLRNLTVIEDARGQIKKNYNIDLDFSKMNYDDKSVYDLISNADTDGVFQLESPGMKEFLADLKPDCFEDVVAGISLYRPGPMDNIPQYIKNKRNPAGITYIHDSLEPILSVTYGVIVYQEQVMQIVRDLGGFSFGRSDEVRRAMGKKKLDIMEAARHDFVGGCKARSIDEDIAIKIFDQLIEFANYGFNKSHAAAYAVIAYQTAYLKAHYRPEFMAALMTSWTNDTAQIAKYIKNSELNNIEVLPPCVLTGEKRFSVHEGKIVFGMQGIKGVGDAIIDSFITLREEMENNGKQIATLDELVSKLPIEQLNKRAFEALTMAGAFDRLEGNRAQKMAAYPMLAEREKKARANAGNSQLSMFDLHKDAMGDTRIILPNVKEFSNRDMLEYEKSVLGIYVSGHPLDHYKDIIEKVTDITTVDLFVEDEIDEDAEQDAVRPVRSNNKIKNRMNVSMVGIISSVKKINTKKGEPMAFISLEDMYGEVEVIIFPKAYNNCASLLEKDRVAVLRGKLELSDTGPKIFASKLTDVSVAVEYFKDIKNRELAKAS